MIFYNGAILIHTLSNTRWVRLGGVWVCPDSITLDNKYLGERYDDNWAKSCILHGYGFLFAF